MENSNTPDGNEKVPGFAGFAAKRIIIGIILAVVSIWFIILIFGWIDKNASPRVARHDQGEMQSDTPVSHDDHKDLLDFHAQTKAEKSNDLSPAAGYESISMDHVSDLHEDTVNSGSMSGMGSQKESLAPKPHEERAKPAEDDSHARDTHEAKASAVVHEKKTAPAPATKHAAAEKEAAGHHTTVSGPPKAKGVAFVEALIGPLDYELNERWYGWRPNDIIDVTDNVNNEQLGVLEFTRRTSIVLVERISRTGSTAAFDPNLQHAMNWFMIKAEQYWLPSPEDKYNEGLENLREYKRKLENGKANFYTRNDNLIPLLSVYEDLLGGCEENLVKQTEDNGDSISFFMADDYFFYAKGVAKAMLPVLEAIAVDFAETVEARRGTDVLHHAIEALHHATEIDPLIITDNDLDGILANHRANLAAPISHARFYIGVLIKTLST